jgi:hypothetical protein
MDFLVTSKHVSKIFPKSNGQFSSTPQDKYRIPVGIRWFLWPYDICWPRRTTQSSDGKPGGWGAYLAVATIRIHDDPCSFELELVGISCGVVCDSSRILWLEMGIFPWPELQGYLEVEPTAVSLPRLRCPRTFGLLALY